MPNERAVIKTFIGLQRILNHLYKNCHVNPFKITDWLNEHYYSDKCYVICTGNGKMSTKICKKYLTSKIFKLLTKLYGLVTRVQFRKKVYLSVAIDQLRNTVPWMAVENLIQELVGAIKGF